MADNGNYVATFPLKTEIWQEHILEKRFRLCERIYNTLNHRMYSRYFELAKTKEFRNDTKRLSELYKIIHDEKVSKEAIKEAKKENKEILKKRNELYKANGFSKFAFYHEIIDLYEPYKDNIDSYLARGLADNLWRGFEDLLYGNGKKTKYKRRGSMRSVYFTSDKGTHILQASRMFKWKKLRIPIVIDEKNPFLIQSFDQPILYTRLLREAGKHGRNIYYVQLCFSGLPPARISKKTGEFTRKLGKGKVGLFIEPTQITVVSDTVCFASSLAPRQMDLEARKVDLTTKMERSRRATNPDNYNEDGTIKKQGPRKVHWVRSKQYVEYQKALKYMHRKEANVRKYDQECLANAIMCLGDTFIINKIESKKIQMEDGGKTIHNYAPSNFVSILTRKAGYFDGVVQEVKQKSFDPTTYDHVTGEIVSNQRYRKIHDMSLPTRYYAAFLLQHYENKDIDTKACEKDFNTFVSNLLSSSN